MPNGTKLAGWAALAHTLGVQAPVPNPSCISEKHVLKGRRVEAGFRVFDKRYHPGNQVTDHLVFALRHEHFDLLTLKRVLEAVPKIELEAFVRTAPTGSYARRLWFFYEYLTGQTLNVETTPTVKAVDALDSNLYFTGEPRLSRRHRVRDNLLGSNAWCPVIRRTKLLEAFSALDLSARATQIFDRANQHILNRAVRFLLLSDSRASFEIEGEHAPQNRLEHWGKAVLQAGNNALTLDEIIRLHNILLKDMRFVYPGLRFDGVFLGERDSLNDPLPEFIGARPEDLRGLCDGMLAANTRMVEDGIDPVLQAAATAFGFVYVHPFQDGNGRVHRCLINFVLANRKFTPPGAIFPVSSVMLDRIDDYRKVLQAHSSPLLNFIEWRTTAEKNVMVLNETADLYRYYDCTREAEFLYSCVQRTVEHDLPYEIEYLRRNDEAKSSIREHFNMPERLVQNLILFIRQNEGRLSRRKRAKHFSLLSDDEVAQLETIVREAFEGIEFACK